MTLFTAYAVFKSTISDYRSRLPSVLDAHFTNGSSRFQDRVKASMITDRDGFFAKAWNYKCTCNSESLHVFPALQRSEFVLLPTKLVTSEWDVKQ